MPEGRVWAEGTLRWVAASGVTGGVFPTAASPRSGLIGFVQAGMSMQAIQRAYATIEDRGVPSHHKLVRLTPQEWGFSILEGNTADYPNIASATAAGATVIKYHLELRQSAPEGVETALYYHLLHAVILTENFTENPEGNVHAYTFRGLSARGPTGSGYLS